MKSICNAFMKLSWFFIHSLFFADLQTLWGDFFWNMQSILFSPIMNWQTQKITPDNQENQWKAKRLLIIHNFTWNLIEKETTQTYLEQSVCMCDKWTLNTKQSQLIKLRTSHKWINPLRFKMRTNSGEVTYTACAV